MGVFQWLGKTFGLSERGPWSAFYGRDSVSGENVTYQSAMQLDAVWACVNLKSKTVGTLPCVVYDVATKDVASKHPLYNLLHNMPNEDDTASEFWEMAALSLCLDGNFFAEKKRNGSGALVAIHPLDPFTVSVGRDERNRRYYQVTERGGTRRLTADDMFHVRDARVPGSDRGISPIEAQVNVLGNATSAEKASGRTFKNGMLPSIILTTDQVLSADKRAILGEALKKQFNASVTGNATLLEAGITPHAITLKPEDAQLLETRRFSVEQICRVFGVPPIMIGHAADGLTTWGSGVEQIILQFTKTGLRPLLKKIEEAIYRDLMTREDRKKVNVKFNMEGLLRGDHQTRMLFLQGMVNTGIYTQNEARGYENLPPVEGGDQLLVNGTMTPSALLGREPAQNEAPR